MVYDTYEEILSNQVFCMDRITVINCVKNPISMRVLAFRKRLENNKPERRTT